MTKSLNRSPLLKTGKERKKNVNDYAVSTP